MKSLSMTVAILAGLALPFSANATTCKDAKGKFIKCPPAAAAPAPKSAKAKAVTKVATKGKSKTARCRNAKGKFAKCGTPGAKPA
jgi:hypothetical protein